MGGEVLSSMCMLASAVTSPMYLLLVEDLQTLKQNSLLV